MALAAEFMGSAPAEWKRVAARPGYPDVTLTGLFASRVAQIAIDYVSAADISHVFEADGAAAQAFGLVVGDTLLIDGNPYSVADLIPSDMGTLTAVLRRGPG